MAFAIFGLTGLFLAIVVIPVVRLGSASQAVTEARVQRIVYYAFRGFIGLLSGLGLARFTWEGVEALRTPGTLVVANHPTLIDAVAIISCMPKADCVVKQENFENPFYRGTARAAGYIPNTGGLEVVEDCSARLLRGRSLVLFPEGTRSPANRLGSFQRGAAHIALQACCNPLPVVITCEPPTLMKGQKWYDVPDGPFHLTVRVGEPLAVQDAIESTEPRGRAARSLTAALHEYFEARLVDER